MALPPREQRHLFLRYEGLQYTEADIEDFEMRLTRIYRREVHKVQVPPSPSLDILEIEKLLTKQGDEVWDLSFAVFSWSNLRYL
ncbi:hypothetical protein Tco_0280500 [Tanacetum coccineum]